MRRSESANQWRYELLYGFLYRFIHATVSSKYPIGKQMSESLRSNSTAINLLVQEVRYSR